MKHQFTLEFWEDEGWYVGRLKEVPGVFSQGETLAELEQNIADAYRMIAEDASHLEHPTAKTKDIFVDVA
ncbi:MAG: type II toxin-antitoxin system HicB family antitoxin [Chromatiaceae bacterium]|jgi:predicted RNase H-like HicB family nuclease